MNSNEILVYCRLKADGYTKQAIAAVMGVCAGESGFQTLSEVGYTTTPNANIRNIFAWKLGSKTDAYINQCKTSDYNFFNCVYGGEAGNSPTEGYKYRGRGFNGITFKDNYKFYGNKMNAAYNINVDLEKNPELLAQPQYAAMALSQYFQMVKGLTDFETAFQEAYRQNAGPANSFAVYAASQNAVHLYGIPKKRTKGQYYLNAINAGEFSDACGGSNLGPLGASGVLTSFPIIFFLTLGGYYLYKKFRK
jgi:predicted chitinase